MIGLLLLTTLLSKCAQITNGCEYTGRAELKLHGKINPWLSLFFNKQYNEQTKTLLECLLKSGVAAVHKLGSSDLFETTKVKDQYRNSAQPWYDYQKIVLELKSQDRAHSKEMMHLIYEVKTKFDEFQQEGKLVEVGFKELQSIIPNNMKAIIFGEATFIKTQVYSYLVSATTITWGEGYIVQTCRARTCRAQTSEWYFEPHEENGRLYFYIKNNFMEKGRVLTLTDSNQDFYSKFVEVQKMKINDNKQKWFVEPVKDGRFVIRNWNGPYIYAYKDRCWSTISNCLWMHRRLYNGPNILTDGLPMTYPKRCEIEKFRELIIETEPF